MADGKASNHRALHESWARGLTPPSPLACAASVDIPNVGTITRGGSNELIVRPTTGTEVKASMLERPYIPTSRRTGARVQYPPKKVRQCIRSPRSVRSSSPPRRGHISSNGPVDAWGAPPDFTRTMCGGLVLTGGGAGCAQEGKLIKLGGAVPVWNDGWKE
jgi:hypothetical protein